MTLISCVCVCVSVRRARKIADIPALTFAFRFIFFFLQMDMFMCRLLSLNALLLKYVVCTCLDSVAVHFCAQEATVDDVFRQHSTIYKKKKEKCSSLVQYYSHAFLVYNSCLANIATVPHLLSHRFSHIFIIIALPPEIKQQQ